jgi:2-polyprenyl-3-methyl-5-hydroxy-6-metoxy-1,4-benzoquinol methylase
MQTSAPDLTQLKSRMKATWMAGDFGKIAHFTAGEASNFVDRIAIPPGAKVLDVACGTGKYDNSRCEEVRGSHRRGYRE